MKLTCLGSIQICGWSPAMRRAAAPSTCRPVQNLVPIKMAAGADELYARASSCVPPVQKWILESGRITHGRSASCRWIGTPPKARLHSTIEV